jgi:hypothetical protein
MQVGIGDTLEDRVVANYNMMSCMPCHKDAMRGIPRLAFLLPLRMGIPTNSFLCRHKMEFTDS